MQPVYKKTYQIETIHTDCFGALKPSVLLYFVQEASAMHSDLLGTGAGILAEKDLFWAVIRHRVQITRLPRLGETITVQTWPMPTTRTAYPRSVVAYDGQGNEVFRAVALWVLMSMHSRSLILPAKSGVQVNGTLLGSELSLPGSILPKALENSRARTVCYTDLDANGHMNNTRYLDWVCDLFGSQFHQSHPLKEFTVCYLTEAREGQKLTLSWQQTGDGVLQVEGIAQTPDVSASHTRVFAVQMLF